VAHILAKHALIVGNQTWVEEEPRCIRAQMCKDILI